MEGGGGWCSRSGLGWEQLARLVVGVRSPKLSEARSSPGEVLIRRDNVL